MITLTRSEPYTFTDAYAMCFEVPEVAMDHRHIFMLHGILSAWPFKSMLELGSFNGASATAFVEAINAGAPGIATFCDVSVSASLIDVVGNCRYPEQVRITPQPSWAVLDSKEEFDFILVDAAHDIDSVSLELKRLMRRRPLCVMAHDTSATVAGYSKCEGAQLLKETFVNYPDYFCTEDNENRAGERTERGLFFATTNLDLFRVATAALAKWA